MPPEKQIVQDDRDARAEELESAFSYDGYQVVRKELFAHLRDPAIVIRKDSITFNTACITGLEDVVYVHVIQFIQALLEANELAVGKDHQFKGRYEAEKNAVIISLEKDEREW